MKTLLHLIILQGLILSSALSIAQDYSTTLDINNVNALIKPIGNQFNNWEGYPMYFVPTGEGTSTIYTSTLWIGGFDDNESLHFAGERFRQMGNDYIPGPLSFTNELQISNDISEAWDTIWEINRIEIQEFLSNQNNPDYQIPQNIVNWPAHGNTDIGQSHKLAPFFDINNDGNYNPEDGDYPNIRGDKCLFFIFNDLCEHSESGGKALGIEIHGMAYAFNVPDNDAFHNAVFLNYKIINRSDTTYNNTYIGIFTDFDIGYGYDDYIGCDVDRGSFYAYNGDDFDESTSDITGFGENPPAQSATLLGGPYMDNDGIDNPKFDGFGNQIMDESINGLNFGDGIIDNERLGMTGFYYFNNSIGSYPATTDPNAAIEYYNYLLGYWKDNTPLLYGGTGHYSGTNTSSTNAKFMFPGNPSSDTHNWGTNGADLGAWSEESESNIPGDRRGMCSSGAFTFEPDDTAEIDIVFVYGVDVNTKSSSCSEMKDNIDIIRNGFINNITPDGDPIIYTSSSDFKTNNINKYHVYPNPANGMISIYSKTPKNAIIEIYNANGQIVKSKIISKHVNKNNISTNDLKAGLYFIKIKSEFNTITKKISIIH